MSDQDDKLYKAFFEGFGRSNSLIPGGSSLLTPRVSGKNLLAALGAPSVTKKSMALKEQLTEETETIFREAWDTRDGDVVPEPSGLQLGNDAVKLNAAIMYADMRSSTAMVDNVTPTLAAEIYKAYLNCAARIIKTNGGVITAYDGDRIMAVFIGGRKNTNAAKTALKINWAVANIVNPSLRKQYGDGAYQMSHVIGVDTSKVLVSRIGVRNDNDLVWVGRAANYAAKMSAIDGVFETWITDSVFKVMHDDAKYGGTPREIMWQERCWAEMNNMRIYGSSWEWPL